MRCLLVDPYYLNGHSPPNWSLGVLEAAMLERHWEVSVLDFCLPDQGFASLLAFRQQEAAFIEAVAREATRCSAIFVTTSFGVPQKPTPILARVERLLRAVRAAAPGIAVHVGGAQIDNVQRQGHSPSRMIAPGLVDFFHPQPERTLLPTLASSAHHEAPSVALGLRAWPGPAPEGSTIPLPRWQGWDLAKYPDYRTAITSLGCRYSCSFCFEAGVSFEAFPLAETIASFADAGMVRLAIEDSTIFGAHGLANVAERSRDLPAGMVFTAYALVNEIQKLDPAHLRAIRAAGLVSVILGIESPDGPTLRRYRKHVSADRVRAVIDKLHEADLEVQGCLMVGIPGVSLDLTMTTFDYALDLDIDVRRWHVFQPSFSAPSADIRTDIPLSFERFARLEVNVPSEILPELFATDPCPELFLEEHALVRSLPYVDAPVAGLEKIRYQAGYGLDELFLRMRDVLGPTKGSFDEEDYYRVLCPRRTMHDVIYDARVSTRQG